MRLAEPLQSLVYPLQELRDRLNLEITAPFVKEEEIQEAGDQQSARYTLAVYTTVRGSGQGEKKDFEPIVTRIAQDVFGNYDVEWEMHPVQRSRNTQEFAITIFPAVRQARFRGAASPYNVIPLTVYVDEDVYNLATDGRAFVVLKNGEVLLEAPSPAYALGALCALAPQALDGLQQTQDLAKSPPHDFLAGLATAVLDWPGIPDEAKEHFVRFYELTTLRDFEAQQE